MMKRLHLLLLVLISCPSPLLPGNGSVYSRFGVGELLSFMSGRSAGMGGTGLALLTDGYINRTNPAALTRISRTRISGNFQYRAYSMNDGSTSSLLSSANFQGLMLAFPLHNELGIVLSGGVTPFSAVSYAVVDHRAESSGNIVQKFEGNGGLSSAQISLAISPLNNLSVGMTSHYLFGMMRHRQSLEFLGTNYFTSEIDRSVSLDGFAATIGGLYTGLDKALNISTERNLDIAATVFTGGSLHAVDETLESFVTSRETTVAARGRIKIPFGISAGIAYLLQDRAILTGDVQAQNWSSFQYLGIHPKEIRNSLRLGIGVEFLRPKNVVESFFDQVTYRFGAFLNSSYLRINGQPINEYFATAGTTLPITTEAKMTLGLEYGIRGTTANTLQKETIVRFTMSLSASELWFIPPEIE